MKLDKDKIKQELINWYKARGIDVYVDHDRMMNMLPSALNYLVHKGLILANQVDMAYNAAIIQYQYYKVFGE